MAEPRNEDTTEDQAIGSETGSQQNVDRDILNNRESEQFRGGGDQNEPTDPDSPDADVDRDDSVTE